MKLSIPIDPDANALEIPPLPEFLCQYLGARPLESQDDLEDCFVDLLATGILNAYPFAKFSESLLVSRLYPGHAHSLGVGVLDLGYSDVITISPDGDHWVEGLLCHMNLTKWAENMSESELRSIVEQDRECWTDPVKALRFLISIQALRNPADSYHQARAKLWTALGQATGSVWFSSLGRIWATHPADLVLATDAPSLAQSCPAIFNRIAAAVSARRGDFDTLDPLASWFITQDDVFDAAYNWHAIGIVSGDLASQCSTMMAKAYCNADRPIPRCHPAQEDAWYALGTRTHDYDGSEHYAFAQSIASVDPELAFVYLCNASSYYAMQRRELNHTYFELAQQLAADNHWENMNNWFQWLAHAL